jgi:beta-phosphoglucomutase-like phosphatase (HAD superfamily)/SAM-dependent methyltransferase
MLRPVVLDMDGVLVDSEPLNEAAFRAYVSSLRRPELSGWFANTLGRREVDFLPELAAEVGRPAPEISAALAAELEAVLSGAELTAMPFVSEAVARLTAGDRLVGLASSSRRLFVDRVLDALDLSDVFAAIATGDEVARGKPDPEIYELVARRLAVPAPECVAIEDTPAGVAAAAAAGMTTIAVPNALTARLDLSRADAVTSDLREAVDLVLRLDGAAGDDARTRRYSVATEATNRGNGMAIDLDTYRAESRESWGQMAPGWERRHDWLMQITGPVNDWLADAVDPQPGQTVLDIAAGTGDLGFQIAERVGDGGRVISSDFAPEMVDVARRFAEARGLTNVEHRVMDAESMDLEDDSVDAAVCRWAYMLIADPAAALRETRRVLRGGGPLAFAVWRTPDRNPWAAVPGMTLVQRGHMPPPEPGAPGIFGMGEPGRIRELVTAAGFGEPEREEIAFEFRYADSDDLWDSIVRLAGPLARAIMALPEDERQATRAAILENLAPYRNGDGSYAAPAATWAVVAR